MKSKKLRQLLSKIEAVVPENSEEITSLNDALSSTLRGGKGTTNTGCHNKGCKKGTNNSCHNDSCGKKVKNSSCTA